MEEFLKEEFPKEEGRRRGPLKEEGEESRSGGAKCQCRWGELGESFRQPARRRRPAPGQERSRRPASC